MVSGPATALATVQPLLDVMARNAPVVGTKPGRRAEGQTGQPAALRSTHRRRRRSPRLRRGARPGRRRHLGSPPARRRSLLHARGPRRAYLRVLAGGAERGLAVGVVSG